jgi:hypothetical protein
MNRIMVGAVMMAALPSHTAYLSDGGMVVIDGNTYTSEDSFLGVPTGFESLNEGVGDEAPAAAFTFNPPSAASSSSLNNPALANSRIVLSVVEIDEDDGTIIGDAEQIADLIVDNPTLRFEDNSRQLELACVSSSERLFLVNQGNSLSPSFHEQVWPGEKGLVNASGVSRSVAWGAASAPRGSTSGGGGGAGGGDGTQQNFKPMDMP